MDFTVYYVKDKEELLISSSRVSKSYNRIVTPGDVGRAVKDFMMEVWDDVTADRDNNLDSNI